MIQRTYISYFDSIFKKTKKQIAISEYFDWIKKGKDQQHIKQVNKLRKLLVDNPALYKEQKKFVSAVTVSSLISGKRTDANVETHTGIIAIDVDQKQNNQKAIDSFRDSTALAYHKSLGGNGLVVYYLIPTDKHREAFVHLSIHLKDNFGLIADKGTGSVSQFRYISYDPGIVINWKAKQIAVPELDEPTIKLKTTGIGNPDQDEIISLVELVEKRKLSIVDDYADWIKLGSIIYRVFTGSEQGLHLFDRVSKLSANYESELTCRKKYNSFKSSINSNPAGVGSFVKMIEDSGFNLNKQTSIKQLKTVSQLSGELSWRDFLITEEPPEEEALIQFDGVTVCTAGNHTLIIGKKKSRKSLFISWMISQYVEPKRICKDVLLVDTEQGKRHVWKSRERIKKVTGQYINTLYLRGESPKLRRKLINQAVAESKPKILFIDGIRDLLYDINDPKECTEVVTWIEQLTVESNIHVVDVLHLNKTDQNARGHIGSELLNKAETTIELELNKESDLTIIKCESSRDVPFETFAFSHDLHGLPRLCELPSRITSKFSEDDTVKKLKIIFKDYDERKYQDLVDEIKINFSLGTTRAKQLVADLQFRGLITGIGQPRSPQFRYKLVAK